MAVLPTDFSVTSTRSSPIPNPDTTVSIPVIKGAEDAAIVDKPVAKNAQIAATLNVPLLFTGQNFADIAAPSVKTSIADGGINTPVLVNDQTQPNIANPSLVNDQAQPDIANPSLVNDQDSAAIATPSAKISIAQPDIANPSLINDQDDAAISTPSVKTPIAQPSIANPSLVNDQDSASISAPSAITSSVTDLVAPPFPLNHARILYENILSNYSSTSAIDGDAATVPFAAVPNTFQRFTFTTTARFEIEMPREACDTICIGAHNLASGGYTVQAFFKELPADPYSSFSPSVTPSSNASIMFHVPTSVNISGVEIRVTGGAGGGYIGYVAAGVALQMQRPFFGGHTPITDATVTKFYDSWTESGNIIGRSKRSQGQETTADFKNIDDGWYRTYFQDFKESALTLPYFFAWNLLEYPDDVGMCFTDGDISAPYTGTRALRSISFTMKGAL